MSRRRDRRGHCQVDLTHWSRFTDGELPAAECRRCEAHLKECAECRAALEGLRGVLRSCRQIGREAVPRAVKARARRRARRLMRG